MLPVPSGMKVETSINLLSFLQYVTIILHCNDFLDLC